MAVWKRTLAGHEVKIHDVDHPPPHCHIRGERGSMKVNLYTLEVMGRPQSELPPNLRRALRDVQEELLEAWDNTKSG